MEISMEKENKMGVMPVRKLLVAMSLPMMFSMLVQAMYNIVDSIFISRVSEAALTAVSLAFPLQMLMIAFSVGTAVGINSLLARRLGQKNREEARKVAETGIALMMLTYIVFGTIGLFLPRTFIGLFTKDPALLQMGSDYLGICMTFSFGIFLSIACEKIIQGTGETLSAMAIQLIGAVINIILDPILIFGLLGFPAMGIKGAAYATVMGQIGSMALGAVLLKRNPFITVRFLKARLNRRISKDIYNVGLPSIIMQSIGTVMTSAMNMILISFTPTATTVFGAYFKIQSFVFMPVFGLNSGLIPIVGYNFGARNRVRIHQAVKHGVIIATGIMFIGFMAFQLFPGALLSIFKPSEEMMSIGTVAFRRISWSFLFAGGAIMLSGVFQGVGDGIYSMYISITRQLLVLIPGAWLLGRLFGLEAVWLSFIISECISAMLSITLFQRESRKLRGLEPPPDTEGEKGQRNKERQGI